MSDDKKTESISILQGELRAQQRVIDQIKTGATPVVSSIAVKKEVVDTLQKLAADIRTITLNATKHAFSAGGGASTADIMLDTFRAINEVTRKHELQAADSLTAATQVSHISSQIIDLVEKDSKEIQSRMAAFHRLQQTDLSEKVRKVGARPETIRRKRQFKSALDDANETGQE